MGDTDIYTHYRVDGDGNWWFHDNRKVHDDLPPKFYSIGVNPMTGELFLTPRDSLVDEIVPIPNPHADEALQLAKRFIAGEFEQNLKSLGLINKMAMMLWGDPGTSKTVTIHQIIDYALQNNWVVLDGTARLDMIASAIRQIRMVEPGRGVVVIWEEFERLIDNGYETDILQLLDGSDQLPNVLYIMTTNFIGRVPKRIFTRCRRIPFQVEFDYPGPDERRAYFENKIPENMRDKVDIDTWVDMTDGFSIDHCAQVLVGVFAFGKTIEDVIQDLRSRMAVYGDGMRMDIEPQANVSEILEKAAYKMEAYDDYDDEDYYYAEKAAIAHEFRRMASEIRTGSAVRVKKASARMGIPLVVF